MTTAPIPSITDEQIAEIENYVNLYADPVIPPQVSYAEIAALIARLRAAERDAARMDWLESAWGGHSGRDGGFHLSVYMPSDAETLSEMIDTAMKGDKP